MLIYALNNSLKFKCNHELATFMMQISFQTIEIGIL